MKSMLLVICVLLVSNVFSQEKYLSISNGETGKEKVFKQNKRVRVRTIQGGKLNGVLQIIDDEHVMIKSIIIPISSIEKIKNNPIALNIIVSGTLFIISGYAILGGVILIIWGAPGIGLAALAIGTGSIAGGILSHNFLPTTKVFKNTTISIKTME